MLEYVSEFSKNCFFWYTIISRLTHIALYFGRDRKPDLPEKQELNTMLLVNLMQSQGRTELVEVTFREHRRRRRVDDEKEFQDESDTDDDLVLN